MLVNVKYDNYALKLIIMFSIVTPFIVTKYESAIFCIFLHFFVRGFVNNFLQCPKMSKKYYANKPIE